MSRRYGRNQKRRHRHEIERLERKVHRLETSGFAPATGRHMSFEEFVGAYLEVAVHDTEDTFTVRREATIRFIPKDRNGIKRMAYHSNYSGLVEWRGIVWQLVLPHRIQFSEIFYDSEVVEMELRAVGTRDSTREPMSRRRNAA